MDKDKVNKNNLIKRVLIFVFISLNFSCQNFNPEKIVQSVNEPFDIAQEEYLVIKTLLKDKRQNLVVFDEPIENVSDITQKIIKKEFPEIQTETLNSYIERNKVPLTIHQPPFDFNYYVISKKGNEKRLEKEVQYYEFSRVGFSKDGKQAFVYFSDICKALCGQGASFLLNKEDNQWKVIKKTVSWES